MKILITAGPTQEAIDPVRYLSNRSSGKMGYALVKAAKKRGWQVTLISGPVHLDWPDGVMGTKVLSAQEMFDAVKSHRVGQDIIVMCAAVADYTPVQQLDSKRKKSGDHWNIELKKTEDILKYLGHHRVANELVVGFCLESDHLLDNARGKLEAKKADVIFANPAQTMESDEIACHFLTRQGQENWESHNKTDMASRMIDALARIKEGQDG